ncbi:MAG: hypothetical protein ACFB4J_16985 [Elainellaceae cyanobacterium]
MKRFQWQSAIAVAALMILGCEQQLSNDYQSTATTEYVWKVEYVGDSDRPTDTRVELFEETATSLENVNGQMPPAAVTGPDDKGLWWPALPPRPTVDDLEARQQRRERIGTPELLKRVDYTITYWNDGGQRTVPTNYSVYRQVVKATEAGRPLELTVAANGSVTKAELR